MTEFFMPMIPPTSTHQQQGHTIDKHGNHKFYQRQNGDAEAKLKAHLYSHIPQKPYTGAIEVVTKWCYPIKGNHMDGEPYTNKPDADNLCKALYDIMSKLGFWHDDKQIYSSITQKFWSAVPGIYVKIKGIDDYD